MVVLHHDLVVVVDPDVLVMQAVRDRLRQEQLHVLAFTSWHDAVRQMARSLAKLKLMPLPEHELMHDPLELWHLLQDGVCPAHRGLSVLPAVSLRASKPAVRGRHPVHLLAHELRECHQHRRRRAASPVGASISTAERRVVELLREGLSNKAIAELLCLSQRTVESHLHRLFRKLNVNNRTELALALG